MWKPEKFKFIEYLTQDYQNLKYKFSVIIGPTELSWFINSKPQNSEKISKFKCFRRKLNLDVTLAA